MVEMVVDLMLVLFPKYQGVTLERYCSMLKVSVLSISVCAMCCIGGGHCGMCWGTCCPLVNTVLSTLVEVGELSVDAEVSVSVLFKCILLYLCCLEYTCSRC